MHMNAFECRSCAMTGHRSCSSLQTAICGLSEGRCNSLNSKPAWFTINLYCNQFQQLYMAAGENESEGSSMGASVSGSLSLAEPVACAGSSSPLLCSDTILREGQQSEQLCVVCHYFPLSRALLPCRHTCICAVCFCEYFNVLNFWSQRSYQTVDDNKEKIKQRKSTVSDLQLAEDLWMWHRFDLPRIEKL